MRHWIYALFGEDALENAVAVPHHAATQFGVQAAILSDNDLCFVSRGCRKKPADTRTLIL